MRTRWIALVCVVMWGTLGGVAAAQQKPDFEQAKRHYLKAQEALHQGDFSIAAREFGKAYEITKDPILFYKIALAHESAGDCESALIYYGRYLREANPSEQDKADAEARVVGCEAAVGSGGDEGTPDLPEGGPATGGGAGTQTGTGTDTTAAGGADTGDALPSPVDDDVPLPAAEPTFIDEEPSWSKTAGWVSVGVAVAAATTGAVLGLSASSREEDVQTLIDYREPVTNTPATFEGNVADQYDDAVDEGESLEKLSMAAWGVAGAAAAAAAIFFVIDATSDDGGEVAARGRVTPVVGEDTFGVLAGWEF